MTNFLEFYMYEFGFCIIFYPLFFSIFILVFSNKICNSFVEVIVSLTLGLSFFFSLFIAYNLNSSTFLIDTFFIIDINHYFSWVWLDLGYTPITLSFLYDKTTSLLLAVITFVAWMVHTYSFGYMRADPRYKDFLGFLLLFTFFMLFFVVSNSIVQVFIGWEGVGLCSYLLINFWYQRVQANKSAIKAFVVNKIGDFAFYFALVFIYINFETFNLNDFFGDFDYRLLWNVIDIHNIYDAFMEKNEGKTFFYSILYFLDTVYNYTYGYNTNPVTFISIALCVAAMAKSAQFGLHTWLPDAMEGPTPVSALIHSATMVCAGVILLIRFSFFLNESETALAFITVVGSLTAFFGATVASAQFDIKKIIAYSTCSQIGYMFLACGLSFYGLSLFHLTTHAFFKSLLFLSSGVLIHVLGDEQDMRRALHSASSLPRNYVFFSIGLLSLAGLPFFSGVSKEFIIFSALSTSLQDTTIWIFSIAFFLSLLAAFYTSIYCLNILEYLLPDTYDPYFFVRDSSASYFVTSSGKDIFFTHVMLVPISILSVLSIFSAAILGDFFINFNNFFLNSRFYFELNIPDSFRIFMLLLNIIVIFFFSGSESTFFRQKWHYDYFVAVFLKQNLMFANKYVYSILEKGWLEYFGPTGIWKVLMFLAYFFNSLYTRFVSSYILIFITFFYSFLTLFLFYCFF